MHIDRSQCLFAISVLYVTKPEHREIKLLALLWCSLDLKKKREESKMGQKNTTKIHSNKH